MEHPSEPDTGFILAVLLPLDAGWLPAFKSKAYIPPLLSPAPDLGPQLSRAGRNKGADAQSLSVLIMYPGSGSSAYPCLAPWSLPQFP